MIILNQLNYLFEGFTIFCVDLYWKIFNWKFFLVRRKKRKYIKIKFGEFVFCFYLLLKLRLKFLFFSSRLIFNFRVIGTMIIINVWRWRGKKEENNLDAGYDLEKMNFIRRNITFKESKEFSTNDFLYERRKLYICRLKSSVKVMMVMSVC